MSADAAVGVPARRPVEIKVCGLTRAADARLATALGARYLGFIFAPSPRRLTLAQAAALLAELDASERAATRPLRVGVFAGAEVDTVVSMVERLRLDVIQWHDADGAERLRAVRAATAARIWSVVHVGPEGIAPSQLEGAALSEAVLLDAKVDGQLGGTGRTFDWDAMRDVVAPLRASRRIILAGGLRADNVVRAIRSFAPDVVDVSSGVEVSPGLKDPARMRAFVDAVHGVALA